MPHRRKGVAQNGNLHDSRRNGITGSGKAGTADTAGFAQTIQFGR